MRQIVFWLMLAVVFFHERFVYADGTFDLELRGGSGIVCGICVDANKEDRKNSGWEPESNFQVYADYLFPIAHLFFGKLELGPYARVAVIKDLTPQAALGGALGYRIGSFELLLQTGFAYSAERIGEFKLNGVTVKKGQSRTTYDLGMELRYFLKDGWYLAVGVGHNSNGKQLGLNLISDKGGNPGYDSVYIGVGKRF